VFLGVLEGLLGPPSTQGEETIVHKSGHSISGFEIVPDVLGVLYQAILSG